MKLSYPSTNAIGFITNKDNINLSEYAINLYVENHAGEHMKAAGAKNLSNDVMETIMSYYYAGKCMKLIEEVE